MVNWKFWENKTLKAGNVFKTVNQIDATHDEFGEYHIDNKNNFTRWHDLALINPHVFQSILKLGFVLTKGLKFVGDEGAVKAIEEWSAKTGFVNRMQNIARMLVQYGTVVLYMPNIETLEILPMEYTTLLPEGIQPGERPNYIMKGNIDKVVLNESTSPSLTKQTVLDIKDCIIFRIFNDGYKFKDNLNRWTYGMYGVSLLQSIELQLKNLMDVNKYYAKAVKRYGIGSRLFFNFLMLEELAKAGKKKLADDILSKVVDAQKNIKANQDIIGYGFDVKELKTLQGTSNDITTYKESLETDIQVGLLQSPLTMGRSAGSTYAAGRVAEEDRRMVLSAIQNNIKGRIEVDMLPKVLKKLGFENVDVQVQFDTIEYRDYELRDMLEAYISGVVTEDEVREEIGLPPKENSQ